MCFYANLSLQVRNYFFPSSQRESEMLPSSSEECNSRRRSIREREDILLSGLQLPGLIKLWTIISVIGTITLKKPHGTSGDKSKDHQAHHQPH